MNEQSLIELEVQILINFFQYTLIIITENFFYHISLTVLTFYRFLIDSEQ